MLKYELLLVLPGTLDDKQVAEKAEEIVKMVKENASEVELHTIGKNRLAYPVKQIRYGYYYTITFQAEAPTLTILENKLSIHRDVLRFLISHFNTHLTSQQKTAFTEGTAMSRQNVEREPQRTFAPAVAAVEKKVEKLDIEQINKKLDDLMGDVMPQV
ncbi:MAG: 30S ribosomal protein S6 [Patescibacteria group bacterium]